MKIKAEVHKVLCKYDKFRVKKLSKLLFSVPVRTYGVPHCTSQKIAFLLQQYKPTDYIYFFQCWRRKQVLSYLQMKRDDQYLGVPQHVL